MVEKPRGELDGDARQAAVANDQVGASADHVDRHVERQGGEEGGEVVGVGGAHQSLGRAADAEPGERRRAARRLDTAPQRRQPRGKRGMRAARHHVPTARFRAGLQRRQIPGSAAAHCVMIPAPRHTTKSPGRAIACTISASRAGDGSGTTERWPRARSPSTSASRFTPWIGASPAAYTSATITVPASFMQVQNSSNSECSRV